MSISARSLLVPGLALATAGAVALGPVPVAPSALTAAQPAVQLPSVHIEDVQLAGIGRDIYDSIQPFVQYTVDSAAYWAALVPFVGPGIADQININYDLIQWAVQSTVYYASDLVANIFAFPVLTTNYAANLGWAGYQWVSAQQQFFGLPPLPPIPGPPPLAATGARSAASVPSRAAASTKSRTPRAAAATTRSTVRSAATAKAASAKKAARSARAAAAK